MKKLILLAIAGLFFAVNSNAQTQRVMPKHQGMTSDSVHQYKRGTMMQELNLSVDQKAKMKALHEDLHQQRNAIQNDTTLSLDQKKEKMKELHKTQMQKMNLILTPEQQAKLKAFREQRRHNHKLHKMDNKPNQNQKS